MKICVLLTSSLNGTDYTPQPRHGQVVKSYFGAYDFFIQNAMFPLAVARPRITDERTEDRYGEVSGKIRWTLPTVGCFQMTIKGKQVWTIPIFTSFEEFLQTPMAEWMANRWGRKWESIQEEMKRQWSESQGEGCDRFTIGISLLVNGPSPPEHWFQNREPTDDELKSPPQGYENEGNNLVPSARKEVGRFFRTAYPMFVVPTIVNRAPSYYSAGGRYYNVNPMAQEGGSGENIRTYASMVGRKLERPVSLKSGPKMKKLTKQQQVENVREWMMEQYSRYQSTTIPYTVENLTFEKRNMDNGWGGSAFQVLFGNFGSATPAVVGIKGWNDISADTLTFYLSSWLGQDIQDNKNPAFKLNKSEVGWPLSSAKDALEASDSDFGISKYRYKTVCFPRTLTVNRLGGGFDLEAYWEKNPMGYMNYGFLDFLSPTIWDSFMELPSN